MRVLGKKKNPSEYCLSVKVKRTNPKNAANHYKTVLCLLQLCIIRLNYGFHRVTRV